MTIRKAISKDVPALNKLVNGAYRGDSSKRGWTTEADLLDGVRTSEASLTQMLANSHATILVAEENNHIQACVYLEQQGEVMYLGMLTVSPMLQGKGLGAELLVEAESNATHAGCKKIKMTVLTARQELIAYYERKGFFDTGLREAFPEDPAFGIPKQPLQFMVIEKVIA